jgi:Putative threonine/serine exporter
MPKQRTDRFDPEYNEPSPDLWRPNLTNLARLSLTNWIPSGATAYTEKDAINRLGNLHGRTSLPFDASGTTIAPPQAALDPYRDIKSHHDPSVPVRVFAKRSYSEVSSGSDSVFADSVDEEGPWEPDDPRLTGVGKNQLDNESWEEAFRKENHRPPEGDEVESRLAQGEFYADSKYFRTYAYENVVPCKALATNRHCILLLGKAMLRFGAPVHRLQGMIKAAQKALDIDHASFIFLPATMLASFGDSEFGCADLRLVKQTTSLDLGRVTQTYGIYKDLTRKIIGAGEAAHQLEKLLDPDAPACWTQRTRCLFAFIQGFLVSIVAFNGCLIDAVVAGLFGLFVFTLGTYPASHSTVFSIVYE